MHVPPCANTGLQAEGEFWEVNESLLASVRSVECKGLTHEIGLEVGCIKASLHLFEALKGDKGVEMAVDSNDMSASLGHSDPALSGGDAVHVALGPDAHGGGHWQGVFKHSSIAHSISSM